LRNSGANKEGLANPTLDKMRRVMSLIYRHSQRYGLIPRNQESNPTRFVRCKTTSEYEAMILTPEQAYAVLLNLREPEPTLTLLAAGTGLRIVNAPRKQLVDSYWTILVDAIRLSNSICPPFEPVRVLRRREEVRKSI
jgi:hypothetical protein